MRAPAPPSTPGPVRWRLEGGDALRGLAALSIVLYHLAVFREAPAEAVVPVRYAASDTLLARAAHELVVGLWVFFVLSGFLVGRPFVRWLVLGEERPRIRGYALRRALRIVPPFWAAAALTFVVLGTAGASAGDVVAVFAFLQVYEPSNAATLIGQAWSLDAEAGFYVVLPLAAVAASLLVTRLPRLELRAAALAGGLLVVAAWSVSRRDVLPDTPPALLHAFVPGVALALAEPWLARRRPGALVAAARGALAAAVAVTALLVLAPPAPSAFWLLELAVGAAIVWALVLRQLAGRGPRALAWRPVGWLGARAYSLYLVHVLVLFWVIPRVSGAPLVALAGLAGSIVAAHALYLAVERPSLVLARRLRSSSWTPSSSSTSPPASPPTTSSPHAGESSAAPARAPAG